MKDFKISDIVKDRYRILASAKEGRVSRIYRCWDSKESKTVALRVLKRKKGIRGMKHASKKLQELSHPKILKILDFFKIDKTYCQIEEFLEGKTLEEILQSGSRMTVAKAVNYICQVLDGLDYLNNRGITHQDIKPENIFVLQDGSVKLIGFGFFLEKYAKKNISGKTLLGTVEYMSPERFKGKSGALSDIYSTAVVLYELLTKENPFNIKNKKEIIKMQKKFTPPVPSCRNPQISPQLDNVILQALAKEKNKRPPGAKQFKRNLKEAAQRPVKSSKPLVLQLIVLAILFGLLSYIIYYLLL